MSVLITGATGLVGMTTMQEVLERTDDRVIALVRAGDAAEARSRIEAALGRLVDDPAPLARRVDAVVGDIGEPGLGLRAEDRARIVAETTHVVHSAATIQFDEELDVARRLNLDGTARILELVGEISGFERLVHVSTAYVAGEWEGVFGEDDLERGQPSRNHYESTKRAAEGLVASARETGTPAVVVRPSAIVGDSVGGWTPAFNVLYVPMRIYSTGLDEPAPVARDGRVDMVPVDYVAEAITHFLLTSGDPPATAALVAGHDAMTWGEAIAQLAAAMGRPAPPIGGPGRVMPGAESMAPYADVRTVFDDTHARAALGPAGIVAPTMAELVPTIVSYARRVRWGKRPITREAAAREAQERALAARESLAPDLL